MKTDTTVKSGETKIGDRMKNQIKDIMQILDKEIIWCEKHPDNTFHKEYRKGFINGLIQAKYLISELSKLGMKLYD